jgi:serine/threonine-protein kinase HipA
MRSAEVYRNSVFVGILKEEADRSYSFEYNEGYFNNDRNPAVSLTLPKTNRTYSSPFLFPFFFNMLSEGVNRKMQSRHLQLSENDHFGLLLAISSQDSIGAILVKEIKEDD